MLFLPPFLHITHGIQTKLGISAETTIFLGLRLNLNIETNEYVADYMDAFGLRLVIHEPGTFPFPEEEGFTLNPRYETTIGMRLVSFDIFL